MNSIYISVKQKKWSSIIGEEITKSGFEVEKFKSDLKEMNVIPSKANKWINLECNPLIADDKQLEKNVSIRLWCALNWINWIWRFLYVRRQFVIDASFDWKPM